MYEATNFEIKEQDMSYNPVSFVVHRIQVSLSYISHKPVSFVCPLHAGECIVNVVMHM